MGQKPALGKGLASLFPGIQAPAPIKLGMAAPEQESASAVHSGTGATAAGQATLTPGAHEASNRDRHMGISMANVEDIQINQYQPRREFDENALDELCQSIKISGIIQPLLVRKGPSGEYQLIAGERRLRAAKKAGLKQVPIVIRKSTDREALELALVENIQRQNLNCIDEALAYFQLMQDFSLTQEEVAQRVGKERATVANFLRLLRLPEAIIDDLKRQIITFGHGKALLGLEDTETRLRARAEVVEKHLSVRDTEALVERLKNNPKSPIGQENGAASESPKSKMLSRFHTLAQELTRHWSAKVEIKGSERRGKIMLHYGSRQELDRLLEAMHNK